MPDQSNTEIWRYTDLTKLVALIFDEGLYFTCPHEFGDPYEGLYPKSHVQAFSSMTQQYIDQLAVTRDQIADKYPHADPTFLDNVIHTATARFKDEFDKVRLKFGVSCWHRNEAESEAMWKLYSALGSGIAIESTAEKLREAILDKSSLVIGNVRYVDFENDPIEKGHENYGLFLKRKSFAHEQEVRATVLLPVIGVGTIIKCDLEKLITKIHVSPFAQSYFKAAVEHLCSGKFNKFCKPVFQSTLFDKPGADYGLNLQIPR